MNLSPIVMFVYNRPWHTQKTIEALQNNELASESELFIYSDNAKNKNNNNLVLKVRKYIKNIEGFKSVTIIERKKNFGLADSIIDGVTKIVKDYGRVIVLEDDLVTSPFFLKYMNNALITYKNEPNVMQISGHMFNVNFSDDKYDALFLPYTSSWGWATWKEKWDFFDTTSKAYEQIKNDPIQISSFDLNNSYPYFKLLELQIAGKIDSWAIRWYSNVFIRKGLTLFPLKTLVKNIGFDGSGTHCGVQPSDDPAFINKPLRRFPSKIDVKDYHKKVVFRFLRNKSSKSFFRKFFIKLSTIYKNLF